MMMYSFKFKASLCSLVFACSCLVFGCGSDNNSGNPLSRNNQKPQGKQKTQAFKLLIDGSPEQGATAKQIMPGGSPNLEVTPPFKAGEPGITQQEAEAAIRASEAVDPQTVEIIPPRKPGERGLTQSEVDAAIKAANQVNSQITEIVPGHKPGERGLTQQEVDDRKPSPVDDESLEIVPPSKPGERGLTSLEIKEIIARQEKSSSGAQEGDLVPPPPPPKTR